MSTPYTVPLPGGIPSTHTEHTESKTTILLPTDRSAFLNPPQQFNRDLSVAVIRAWNERRAEEAEAKYRAKQGKNKGKKRKGKGDPTPDKVETAAAGTGEDGQPVAGPSVEKFYPRKIKIIEALSATGLRSIRYAKEIPHVKVVLANDLSASACEAMKMNVAYNGVGEEVPAQMPSNGTSESTAQPAAGSETTAEADKAAEASGSTEFEEAALPHGRRPGCRGRVQVNEGDACTLMYNHRDPKDRVDVVDLDPYGTAAPFIDAAVSCIADGGLLCVTCTDVAVLAGSNYPEKAYANYGGASVHAEYCHEVGLRLVLNMLATAASRYGRCITPLLSFSIDFYVRVFVTVDTAPIRVKELASNTGIVYVCGHCQSHEIQPFGRIVQKGDNKNFKTAQKTSKLGVCEYCEQTQHVGGPLWIGPIQDSDFATRCLKSIEGQQGDYATWKRMHGMLTVAGSELHEPFYFTCNKLSGFFRATSAPTNKAVYALLNAGYQVSRSHAAPGSIKTNAPRSFVLDIMREWVKEQPVRLDKIAEGNPARVLLAKDQTHEIDFTPHAGWSKFEKGEKVVYYQANPLPNWGPASRARTITKKPGDTMTAPGEAGVVPVSDETKRKAEGEVTEIEVKKPRVDVEADDEESAMNV